MSYLHNNLKFKIDRYPPTNNRSLRSWNAADELTLDYVDTLDPEPNSVAIAHDRFGFLACYLNAYNPFHILNYKSQEKALRKSLSQNKLKVSEDRFFLPLSSLPEKINLGIVKVPKNMDLFRLYIEQLHHNLTDNGTVLCGFMTKYFTPQMLEIADQYFEEHEQTNARKKARLLILKKPKSIEKEELIHTISLEGSGLSKDSIQQYYGVFSSGHIDYASQFFIQHLDVKEKEKQVLDLACGSGILGMAASSKKEDINLHVLDDSWLAVESAKLNLDHSNTHFHFDDSLDEFPNTSFDLVISNPPFHFGHENNIEIAIRLFGEVHRCLKKDGRFQLVASKHLNFATHLEPLFNQCKISAQNEKFAVYECVK